MTSQLDPKLKKEIIRNLRAATDSEQDSKNETAYKLYIESLRLVTEALRQDAIGEVTLSVIERSKLIEYAKESVARIHLINKSEELTESKENLNTAPSAPSVNLMYQPTIFMKPKNFNDLEQDPVLVAQFEARMKKASTDLERHKVELEFARQVIEQSEMARNKSIQASAWAMQAAYRKFKIQEKLNEGTLKDSDFRKQQLYALFYQFIEETFHLKLMSQKLDLHPSNEKILREMLANVFTDPTNPIKITLSMMHAKVNNLTVVPCPTAKENVDRFEKLAAEIKEDLGILTEVLKEIFPILKSDKNSAVLSEMSNYYYFGPVKGLLIKVLRIGLEPIDQEILRKINASHRECLGDINSDTLKEAVRKLHYLATLHNPFDMVDCAVHIVRLLTSSNFDKNHLSSVGADELVPRLCQVILDARLDSPAAECKFMETFIPTEKSLGEEGYAVTMFQSCVAHLSST